MKLQTSLGHLFLASTLALATVGCGSESSTPNSSFSVPGGNPAVPPAPSARLDGNVWTRVVIGAGIPQVNLRLEDRQGQVLGSGTTNSDGLVVMRIDNPPGDGRLVATLPGSNLSLVKEFRATDFSRSRPTVSLLSDLAARLVAQGVPLDQAEARVASLVGLPPNAGLDFAEPNPYFSSLALLQAAAQNGSWDSFATGLLNQRARTSGASRYPYRLRAELLRQPLSGINDPGLAQAAVIIQRGIRQHLGFAATPTAGVPEPSSDAELLRLDVISDGAGAFFFGVAQGIAGNVATTHLEDVMGAIFNGFGQNNASQQQLEAINQELGQALALLSSFVNAARQQQVLTESQNLELLFEPSKTSVREFIAATLGATPQPGTPFTTPSSILRLLGGLQGPEISLDTLTNADSILRGRAGLLRLFIQDIVLTGYGITAVDNQVNPPFTPPQDAYDKMSNFQDHWVRNQLLTLELLSENAHNTFPGSTSPAAALRAVQQDFNQTMVAIKEQIQLQPYPLPSADLVFDVQSNVVWQRALSAATSNWSSISSNAGSVSVNVVYADGSSGSYANFNLPQDAQTLPLQARGQYAPNPGTPGEFPGTIYSDPSKVGSIPVSSQTIGNRGITSAGLAGLGFLDCANFNSQGQIWAYEQNQYFPLNTGNQSATDNGGNQDSRTYLYCRDFCPLTGGSLQAPHPGAVLQFGVPNAISASATPIQVANGTQIPYTVGNSTANFNLPPDSVEFLANVTYQLTVGGAFRVGNAPFSTYQRDPVTPIEPAVQFSTSQNPAYGPNLLRERISWTSSNTNVLRMYNIPGLGGIATPLVADTAVNVTATILDQTGKKYSSTVQYRTPQTLTPPTLTSLQIMPANQIYGAAPSQSANGSFPYYCIAYYSNFTYADVTSTANWTVNTVGGSSNSANAQIVKSGSGASLVMNQPPQSIPTPYNLTVSADYGGKSSSSTIRIVPPVATP